MGAGNIWHIAESKCCPQVASCTNVQGHQKFDYFNYRRPYYDVECRKNPLKDFSSMLERSARRKNQSITSVQ